MITEKLLADCLAHLLTPEARAEYLRVSAPAEVEYRRGTAEYQQAMTTAAAEYRRGPVEVEHALATAAAEYRRTTTPALIAALCASLPEFVSKNAANAALISAAPDLLKACETALAHHQGGHSEVGRQLRAAIAKATGKAATA